MGCCCLCRGEDGELKWQGLSGSWFGFKGRGECAAAVLGVAAGVENQRQRVGGGCVWFFLGFFLLFRVFFFCIFLSKLPPLECVEGTSIYRQKCC